MVSPLAPLHAQAGQQPLKYLQIGVGHPHANKIKVYDENPDWEVVGIVEEDPKLLASAKESETYNNFPFLSLEEGLNTPGLSVVGVETEIRDLLKYATQGSHHQRGTHRFIRHEIGRSNQQSSPSSRDRIE